MSDLEIEGLPQEVVEPENQTTNAPPPDWSSTFLDIDEDIEIGEGLEEEPTGTGSQPPSDEVETLRQQLKDQQERMQQLQMQSAAQQAIQPLVEQLNQPKPQQAQQQPGEPYEEFRKRLDENYLETGITSTMDEYFARRLQPEVQRLLQNNMYMSKKFVSRDPEKGPLYQKYQREVDELVQTLPPQDRLYNPDVYDEAVARVAAKHGDEIINDRVQQQLEAEREKIKEEIRKELGVQPTRKPTYNATSNLQPPPQSRTGGRKMSLEQLRQKYPQHVKDAAARGIPAHMYFRTLARKGMLK